MMSEICRDDSLMPRIVSTTWLTTCPPCIATAAAFLASWFAWRALSAFCGTVDPSCAMEAAVCSSALAWLAVRPLRSWLPWEISALAVATASALWCTLPTVVRRVLARVLQGLQHLRQLVASGGHHHVAQVL
ncbi:hypothetical protein ACFSHV_07145 [Paracidovorax cattleyae]